MTVVAAIRRGVPVVGLAIPIIAALLLSGRPAVGAGDEWTVARDELQRVSTSDCRVVTSALISPTALDGWAADVRALNAADRWLDKGSTWVGSIQAVALELGGRMLDTGNKDSQWVLIEQGAEPYVQNFARLGAIAGRDVWARADAIRAVPSEECTKPSRDY